MQLLFFFLIFFLSGCADTYVGRFLYPPSEAKKDIDTYLEHLYPEVQDFVPQIKQFAVEKIVDLSEAEKKFIIENKPEIAYNDEDMMYSFVWRFKDKEILEVLATPPPCKPIEAYKTTKVYYP